MFSELQFDPLRLQNLNDKNKLRDFIRWHKRKDLVLDIERIQFSKYPLFRNMIQSKRDKYGFQNGNMAHQNDRLKA